MAELDTTYWEAKAAKAQAKVAEKGAPATLHRPGGTYDPDTDTVTDAAGAAVDCHAVLSEQEITDDQGRTVNATIATLTRAPKSGDTLEVGELTYSVIKTLTIAPAGIPLLWSAVLET